MRKNNKESRIKSNSKESIFQRIFFFLSSRKKNQKETKFTNNDIKRFGFFSFWFYKIREKDKLVCLYPGLFSLSLSPRIYTYVTIEDRKKIIWYVCVCIRRHPFLSATFNKKKLYDKELKKKKAYMFKDNETEGK